MLGFHLLPPFVPFWTFAEQKPFPEPVKLPAELTTPQFSPSPSGCGATRELTSTLLIRGNRWALQPLLVTAVRVPIRRLSFSRKKEIKLNDQITMEELVPPLEFFSKSCIFSVQHINLRTQ